MYDDKNHQWNGRARFIGDCDNQGYEDQFIVSDKIVIKLILVDAYLFVGVVEGSIREAVGVAPKNQEHNDRIGQYRDEHDNSEDRVPDVKALWLVTEANKLQEACPGDGEISKPDNLINEYESF